GLSSPEDGLKQLARDAFLAAIPEGAETLYAWVGQDAGEKGVARLKTAWLPLGTMNLVAFDRDAMTHPNLVDALQRQANEAGQALSARWPEPEAAYRRWHRERRANDFGLGAVQLVQVRPDVWVANMVGQHGLRGGRTPPIRYEAVEACLMKVAERARELGASV